MLDAVTALGLLGICAGLASMATGIGLVVLRTSGTNSSFRSLLDFAAERFAFLAADFDGDSLVFPNLAIFSSFSLKVN